jgi:thioredoxin reductase
VQRALLLRNWSDDVTLFANGPAGLEPGDADRLAAAGVAIEERPVSELRGPGEDLEAVVFTDGTERPLGGLLVPVTMHQRTGLAQALGAVTAEPGHVSADPLAVDTRFQTNVPGLAAAGDATVQMPSVGSAIAAGSAAAAAIVNASAAAGELRLRTPQPLPT